MSEQIQVVPEKIFIRSIKILGGNITADPSAQIDEFIAYNVEYGISDDFSFEKKIFRFVLSTRINAIDQNDKYVGITGEYSIEYIFYVDNLEHYIVNKDEPTKGVIIHEILIHTLLSIVYSTSRGIVLGRTQGTSLDSVILPVIDTKTLMASLENHRKEKETPKQKV
jgi:hypothetical protein